MTREARGADRLAVLVAPRSSRVSTAPLTIGVEEEFLLIDPVSGRVVPAAEEVLRRVPDRVAPRLVHELTRFQLETNSAVHTDLRALLGDLLETRTALAAAARAVGVGVAASGTALLGNPGIPPLTVCPRYLAMAREFRGLLQGQGVCGCHVHVGVPDREEALQVSNHARPWLSVLQSLAGNSPFADGVDTGYASWRSVVLGRWPSAEPPPYFRSLGHYERLVDAMLASGALMDRGMIYWYVRLSDHVPTVEFRTADTCATAEETVTIAGLVRALVATALRDLRAGIPAPAVDDCLLRAAYWRAARDGVEGAGLDLFSGRLMPAWRLVGRLVNHVRAALEDSGDWRPVTESLRRLRRIGSGAARQRAAYLRRVHLPDVADLLVRQTEDLSCPSFP
ncbi:glutamate--cysteine ligase [Microbispora sp. RL4-1S]|uniref:Putative glutamate--cysteine ligase 2 n=1 Tax=Microbispora oryzae TaxID=2806554 RepID=A0A940WPJ5_9ACTN|nr:glutamate--cysteine ligase [Microbispora oryzae]